MKQMVRRQNTTRNINHIKVLTEQALASITPDYWKKCIGMNKFLHFVSVANCNTKCGKQRISLFITYHSVEIRTFRAIQILCIFHTEQLLLFYQISQCGNFKIFLPFTFYVKSKSCKAFLLFCEAMNFVNLVHFNLQNVQKFKKSKSRACKCVQSIFLCFQNPQM